MCALTRSSASTVLAVWRACAPLVVVYVWWRCGGGQNGCTTVFDAAIQIHLFLRGTMKHARCKLELVPGGDLRQDMIGAIGFRGAPKLGKQMVSGQPCSIQPEARRLSHREIS